MSRMPRNLCMAHTFLCKGFLSHLLSISRLLNKDPAHRNRKDVQSVIREMPSGFARPVNDD
jgi:hypothetical protein